MGKITNVTFVSFEFDFSGEGKIDSEIFIEIENDGELSRLQHKVHLQDTSFDDFLSEESIGEFTNRVSNFSSYIQNLRKLITLKVASDLKLEVADMDFEVVEPTRSKVEKLEASQVEQDEAIMLLMLGGM